MLPSQVKDEITGVIEMEDDFYKLFGFDYHLELSTRPDNSIGSDEIWELATDALREALEAKGLPYKVNEGDGAFYGPKIDFHLEDSLGRTGSAVPSNWTLPCRRSLISPISVRTAKGTGR